MVQARTPPPDHDRRRAGGRAGGRDGGREGRDGGRERAVREVG
jgi:hypothetical protein